MNTITDWKNKRQPSLDLTTMVYGKIPPQAKELEEVVLGAIMLDKSAFDTAIEILRPECFYVDAHQQVFKAFQSLAQKSMPIDELTVAQELQRMELLDAVGGPFAVTKLTNKVTSSANLEAHARIILEKFIQRELIRISGEIIGDAYEDSTDVFDLLDDAETKMFNISNYYLKQDISEGAAIIARVVNRVDKLRSSPEAFTGVTSGYACIDKITYGWQLTDLIIIAARPSVGKTALALNLARNAALNPKPTPVGIFSLEMSKEQLMTRMLSAESGVPLEFISRGKMGQQEYDKFMVEGVAKLEQAKIFIDDTAALNIFEFRAKARRLVNKHKVGMVIIDYLQLMSGTGERGNREQEISNISRNLKALAKELNIPIIALSQLSRAVETRSTNGNKMPQLSDLRESGAIEQDADTVLFIYRPEYYGQTANDQGESTRGETHIKFAKHRNGAVGDIVKLQAQLHIQKFVEATPEQFPTGNWRPVSELKTRDFSEGFTNDDGF